MRIKSDKNLTSNALIGAALLFLLPGIHQWTITGLTFDAFDWLILGGCSFFLLMATWARFASIPPAALSLVLYLAFWIWMFGPIAMQGKMRPMDWGAVRCHFILATHRAGRSASPAAQLKPAGRLGRPPAHDLHMYICFIRPATSAGLLFQ